MLQPHHKKIAIIGCAGSGKTTLALLLQEKFKLPLYHLDQYYWKPNWERSELAEFAQIHNELCERNAWIMEGSYYKLFAQRARFANVIIFLDAPRYKCLWYVLKRAIIHFGKEIQGSPRGCKQHLLNYKFLEFLYWIWTFNARYRAAIIRELEKFKNEKQVYILKSLKEENKILPR